jgi:hypothetical protein
LGSLHLGQTDSPSTFSAWCDRLLFFLEWECLRFGWAMVHLFTFSNKNLISFLDWSQGQALRFRLAPQPGQIPLQSWLQTGLKGMNRLTCSIRIFSRSIWSF